MTVAVEAIIAVTIYHNVQLRQGATSRLHVDNYVLRGAEAPPEFSS